VKALLIAAVVAALAVAPTAAADTPVASVLRPTPVTALDGVVVWSDYDRAGRTYHLTALRGGRAERLPVAPRRVPFDADVGRLSRRLAATYSRCRREPRTLMPWTGEATAPLPVWETGRGCDVFVLDLVSGRERKLRGVSTRRGSETMPSVSGARIAFVRLERRRPRLYVRDLARGSRDRELRGGPTGGRGVPAVLRLDLAGRRLAFGWAYAGPSPEYAITTEVRTGSLSRAPRPLARLRELDVAIGPSLSAGSVLYATRSNETHAAFGSIARIRLSDGDRTSTAADPRIVSVADDGAATYYATGSPRSPAEACPCAIVRFEPGG
jgi:hypothetical protein